MARRKGVQLQSITEARSCKIQHIVDEVAHDDARLHEAENRAKKTPFRFTTDTWPTSEEACIDSEREVPPCLVAKLKRKGS